MPSVDIIAGKPLPEHPLYSDECTARKFWRLSYECGRRYADGHDALGRSILIKHESEKDDTYIRRKRITKPRNHCGPIARKYNDFVFRQEADRPKQGESATYDLLLEDADAKGTPLPLFMRRSLLLAQIDRECYLLPDSNRPDTSVEVTKAQAAELSIRPFIRRIDADCVPWWRDYDGSLTEAIVVFEDAEGRPFARWYGQSTSADIRLRRMDGSSRTLLVESVGAETRHPYGACPLVRLRPLFDSHGLNNGESQIAPLAELQQSIFNLLALHREEMFNVTFTQYVAAGVSADQVKDLVVGTSRLICLPPPGASFQAIGGDPAQAESISKAVIDEQRELYRIAGVSTGDPIEGPSQVESGVAKAFRFNDLAANLSALADASEEAENGVVSRLFAALAEPYPGDANYPGNFEMPELKGELEVVVRALLVRPLPKLIKRKITQTFVDRNLALDDTEQAELDSELATLGDDEPIPERTFGT